MADEAPAFPTDEDIDDVLAEFDGDHREVIRALLHDLAAVAGDFETSVSRGFVRGVLPGIQIRHRAAG